MSAVLVRADEQPIVLKQAPGLAELSANCQGCHSLDYVRMNAPFIAPDTWKAEITKMRAAYGAQIDDEDTSKILAYLTSNYGPATEHGFRLADHHPDGKPKVSKSQALKRTAAATDAIGHAQDRMMAASTWSLLAVFQGMDTSGKDGTIDHVFQSVNPAGVTVTSFKPPSSNERAQDFLWRVHAACPPAGKIAAFNRSHYEDVLVPRIHREQLHLQHVPPELCTAKIWQHRLEDIENFENMLTRHGTIVMKFFLNISREEQRQRLIDRLDEPAKTWKFSPNDLAERSCWDQYMNVYEETIAATATPSAPWYIIPADHKWFARMAVAEIIAERFGSLDLRPPEPDSAMREALKAAKPDKLNPRCEAAGKRLPKTKPLSQSAEAGFVADRAPWTCRSQSPTAASRATDGWAKVQPPDE
eukprot:gene1983-2019_t